jgi:mono/diheme cytochrome c family protein
MMRTAVFGVFAAGLALSPAALRAQTLAERGKYLVNSVAQCGSCHTPLDAGGQPDFSRHLKGASAPDLTGTGVLWTHWKEAGFRHFLETGLEPSGAVAKHPMPRFKLRPDDAMAITEYLKTLR